MIQNVIRLLAYLGTGFREIIITSLDATASRLYERPRHGENATSLTQSVMLTIDSTFTHFLYNTKKCLHDGDIFQYKVNTLLQILSNVYIMGIFSI